MAALKLWSVSALSIELGLDRRTISKRLAKVSPDGRLPSGPAWYLSTAAPALLRKTGNGAIPDDGIVNRAGGRYTASGTAIDEALACLLVMLAAQLPGEAEITAMRAGADEVLAREIYRGFSVRTCALVDEIAGEIGVEWSSANHFDFPRQPDWEALA